MTEDAGDFDGLVFEGLSNEPPGYTQQPPMTFAEINALLASFERHKQRLIVPTGRVAEFEEDQAFLAASEATTEQSLGMMMMP